MVEGGGKVSASSDGRSLFGVLFVFREARHFNNTSALLTRTFDKSQLAFKREYTPITAELCAFKRFGGPSTRHLGRVQLSSAPNSFGHSRLQTPRCFITPQSSYKPYTMGSESWAYRSPSSRARKARDESFDIDGTVRFATVQLCVQI